jgi:hypothetical protein
MIYRLGPIVQTAYLVTDMQEAMARWSQVLEVPLFYFLPDVPCIDMTYRGKPVDFKLCTAIGYSGDLQIELLLMDHAMVSWYPEFYRNGDGRLHHYQVRVADIDAVLKERAWQEKVLLRAKATGMEICFVDADLPDGSLLEIVSAADATVAFMEGFKQLSKEWKDSPRVINRDQLVQLLYPK